MRKPCPTQESIGTVMKSVLTKVLVVLCFAVFGAPYEAWSLDKPKNTPILELAGSIQEKNQDGLAVFDREMLESIGLQTTVTTTPWDEGQVRFEGVPLAKLLDLVKAKGRTIKVSALNDYTSLIPIDDVQKYSIILALKRNNEYMPVRDKGPLFIVYPFDSHPELKTQVYYARSVWQVRRLEIQQ